MNKLILFLKGIIIGLGKILPGVSGSLIAISLGVYEESINAISNFLKDIKKYSIYLGILGLGILVSIVFFSKIMANLFINHYNFTMSFILGALFGIIPNMWKKSAPKNKLEVFPSNIIASIFNFKQELFFEIEKEEPKSLRNYNVIFLKDQRALFNLDVPLIVQDNALIVRSPFDRLTDQWMNKCLKKGRNVSQELDAVIEDYEASYLIAEKKIESFIEGHKKDFASSLKNCQTLYRIIDALDDNRMREYVVKLDSMYTEQNELFYFYCGKILDRLIRLINYKGKTPGVQRKQTTYDAFCSEIDYALSRTPITYYFLKTKNIYDNWRKKDDRKDGKEFISFKADLTDIMIRTDLKKSPIMYPLFLQDAFNLYAKRSKVDHDDDDSMVDHEIQSSEIDTLTKVVKVLFELI